MRILINGARLFFDVEGAALIPSGPTMREKSVLILVHGGPGHDHTSFKPEFGALADLVQVVYLDLRGNGRSDLGHSSEWNLHQWAEDLREFCRALEIVKPIILGQSFGGEVAMRFAATYPEELSKLILLSCTATLRLDRSLKVFDRLAGGKIRDLAEAYWHRPTPELHREYYRRCVPLYTTSPIHPDVLARAITREEVARFYNGGEARTCNLLPDLRNVKCPTLVMGGTDDPITTIDDALDIVRALPAETTTFAPLPGCRHGPMREAPDITTGILRAFLKGERIPSWHSRDASEDLARRQ